MFRHVTKEGSNLFFPLDESETVEWWWLINLLSRGFLAFCGLVSSFRLDWILLNASDLAEILLRIRKLICFFHWKITGFFILNCIQWYNNYDNCWKFESKYLLKVDIHTSGLNRNLTILMEYFLNKNSY